MKAASFQVFIPLMAKSTHSRHKVLTHKQSQSICQLLQWQVVRVAALYKQEKEIKIIHLHEANAFSENHKAEHFDLIDITSEKEKKMQEMRWVEM